MYRKEALLKRRAELSAAKQALLEQHRRGEPASDPLPRTTIPKRPPMPLIPLSSIQERFWFLQQLDPEGTGYLGITLYQIARPLQLTLITRIFRETARRHEILRTTYTLVEGQVYQQVDPTLHQRLTVPVIDLQSLPTDVRHELVQQIIIRERTRPVRFTQEVPWRATLLHLTAHEYVLILAVHHIIGDGWSVDTILQRELLQLFTAYEAGQPSPLPELPIQYADYAYWQCQQLHSPDFATHLNYWRQHLADAPFVLEMPTDHLRPSIQTYREAVQTFIIDPRVVSELKSFSQQEQVTPFMTYLAAFAVLLARLSGQYDMVMGTSVAGRDIPELESLLGCFINTLALHLDLRGVPSFRALLARVRAVCLNGYMHQLVPLEHVVAALQPPRDLSRSTLFQILFQMQNFPPTIVTEHHSIVVSGATPALDEPSPAAVGQGQCDFTLLLAETNRMTGTLDYDTTLFEPTTIERLLHHFSTLLAAIAATPDQAITTLSLLSPAEREQLLVAWNTTDQPPLEDAHYLAEFHAQVARTPDAIAVGYRSAQLSYAQLNQQANALAAWLRTQQVGPEVIVAVLAERDLTFLTAILAVFKAGGAYLPLDPHHPPTRYVQVLTQSRPALVLVARALLPALQPACAQLDAALRPPLHVLEDRLAPPLAAPNPPLLTLPAHPVYVIYTSGSTGVPKGAVVEQRGMINHIHAKIDALGLDSGDRVAQTASQCFDISVWQFLAVGLVGGCVVIGLDEVTHDPARLLAWVAQEAVTVLEIVPSVLHVLLTTTGTDAVRLPHLRWLIPTGEACPPELCRQWLYRYPDIPLLNAYGPTECSDDVTHYPIHQAPEATMQVTPIGRPIANLRIYLLDEVGEPVPVGVVGELYIGGRGVGRGYLRDAMRTAAVFVPDPFGAVLGDGCWVLAGADSPHTQHLSPNSRLYRTGDRARYLADGTIEFLGRYDRQVKLRGFRIELGEIEAALARHMAVQAAAVVERADGLGGAQLVAYVVCPLATDAAPQDAADAAQAERALVQELRGFLTQQLPNYMLPAAIMRLSALPLSPNGKLDRRALPRPDLARIDMDDAFVAPRTSTEAALVAIWARVLDVERVGVHDNFFELGGHSLLMNKLMFHLQETFHVNLPWRSLFEAPTVAQLATAIENTDATGSSGLALHEAQTDLTTEVVLDPAITASNRVVTPVSVPTRVFLTGATGFLGAFLLHELLQQTHAVVYCLVRAPDSVAAQQRIQSALESYRLWDAQVSARIIPVPGDLAKPQLGLSNEDFQLLAGTVESIYHNGAMVNLLYPYNNLKAPNVLGTHEVLRMASLGTVKPVHYISTLAVVSAAEPSDNHIREHDPLRHSHKLQGGYVQSKWVAEQLLALAHARGIPVCIYRPGRLTGDSQNGACNPNDLFGRLLKSCIQLGSIPDLDTLLELTPVDYVSKAIVHLAQQPHSYGRTYHLFNPQLLHFSDLVAYMQGRGYPLRLLAPEQWRQELVQALNHSHENALNLLSGPLLEQQSSMASAASPEDQAPPRDEPKIDCQATLDVLAMGGITCPAIDTQILDTYFTFFTDTNFLDVPAVETQSAEISFKVNVSS